MPDVYVALIHHPVVNKRGEAIASAVTNLDLHDIARASKTYGVRTFYVVTPLQGQAVLVSRILSHWIEGFGARANPARGEALALIKTVETIGDVMDELRERHAEPVLTVGTSARGGEGTTGHQTLREMIEGGRPCLLLFGTAWGLAAEAMAAADCVLEPISGRSDYNHLSVRSAVSIVLDRLLGDRGK